MFSNDSFQDQIKILHQLRETPEIFEEIRNGSSNELHIQNALRKLYPKELVTAALTLDKLRKRAISKFSKGAEMWFSRQGFEQSTSEIVALHKAKRFDGEVLDLCSGIGGDAIALSSANQVTSIDCNPVTLLRAEWNTEIYGNSSRWQGEAASIQSIGEERFLNRLLHIDPDQRTGSKGRSLRVEDLSPGIEFLQAIPNRCLGGAIKLSPASNFGGKFLNAEIELISVGGECKEATVWFGSLAGEHEWRATVLPAGETISGDPLSSFAEVVPIQSYIYDPDPAVVRSGLLDVVAEKLNLNRLDDAEEYLTSDELVQSPFVSAFRVIDILAGSEKPVRKYFKERNFGQVEIKCRHVPVQADSYRKKLSLKGSDAISLIIARNQGKTKSVICERA